MSAQQIISSLVWPRYAKTFCIPNYTPFHWWECDVFEVTKAGYFREYEIKVSRADFFADAKKNREVLPRPFGAPVVLENKHDLLSKGDERGPVQFWYVVPQGLVSPSEVPDWAGLIEMTDSESKVSRWRYFEKEIKAAPRLHKKKFASDSMGHARGVCYWRMHKAILNRRKAS